MSYSTRAEPPLSEPYYRAPLTVAVSRFFRKYVTFSGRASRAEYWWWQLIAVLVPVTIQIATGLTTGQWRQPLPPVPNLLTQLFALATLVPGLALAWRRLHDTNRSGLYNLLAVVPVVGWIILLVFDLQRSNPAGARYDRPRHRNGTASTL